MRVEPSPATKTQKTKPRKSSPQNSLWSISTIACELVCYVESWRFILASNNSLSSESFERLELLLCQALAALGVDAAPRVAAQTTPRPAAIERMALGEAMRLIEDPPMVTAACTQYPELPLDSPSRTSSTRCSG